MGFKVLSHHYIMGRGFVTVISNPELIPIDTNCFIIQDDEKIPIIGVEKLMTLMTIPTPKPNWGIVTNKEIFGEIIEICGKNL